MPSGKWLPLYKTHPLGRKRVHLGALWSSMWLLNQVPLRMARLEWLYKIDKKIIRVTCKFERGGEQF